MAITLSVLDRLAKFFHCCKEQYISNKMLEVTYLRSSKRLYKQTTLLVWFQQDIIDTAVRYLRWPVTVMPQVYFSLHVRTSTISMCAR